MAGKSAKDGAESGAERVGIAHTLALAEAASVEVKVENGKLVVKAARPKSGVARAIETYLDGLGKDDVIAFLTGTSVAERRRLAAIPPANTRRIFRTRLIPI